MQCPECGEHRFEWKFFVSQNVNSCDGHASIALNRTNIFRSFIERVMHYLIFDKSSNECSREINNKFDVRAFRFRSNMFITEERVFLL